MKTATRYAISVIALVLAGAAGVITHQKIAQAAAAESNAATLYARSFPDSSGKPFPLSGLKGHVVVVNFWATWCAPCVKEIPELSKLSTSYGKKVEFIGIGIDKADKVAYFQKSANPSYPLLVADTDGTDLVREYGDSMGALPFTLVIDAKGNIKATKMGPIETEELKAWLKPLLGS